MNVLTDVQFCDITRFSQDRTAPRPVFSREHFLSIFPLLALPRGPIGQRRKQSRQDGLRYQSLIGAIIAKNRGLQPLEEPWADITMLSGRMVLTMFFRVAEFERALIRSRTDECRQAAMRRGVVLRQGT